MHAIHRSMQFAKRRGIFKRILMTRLAKIDIDLLFIRLEKEADDDPKWDAAWKIFIEYRGEPHNFHSRIYKNEKPFSLKVLKDLVHDITQWKEKQL